MNELWKYPRTTHLPWSLGSTSDDKMLADDSQFHGKEVVVSEKADGENVTMYPDNIHQRSLSSNLSEDYNKIIREIWHSVKYAIPDRVRICGESMIAKHSIEYHDLQSYFYAFGVWEDDVCWSWDDSIMLVDELNASSYIHEIAMPAIIYRGIYDKDAIIEAWEKYTDRGILGRDAEGYVIRLADSFKYDDFTKSVAKYVRENHVQTDKHWKHSKIEFNQLA